MAQNHTTLRSLIRHILKEETVSVFRNSVESIYDVDFNETGDEIVSGRKLDPAETYAPEVDEAMKIAAKFTTVDKATLLNKLTSYYIDDGMEIRQPVGSGEEAAQILNQYWTEAINWPSVSGKGPGEVAMHLAFKSNPKIKEPDFVSADGALRISVKSLGASGTETARSGTRSVGLSDAVEELKAALRLRSFTKEKWGEGHMFNALVAIPAEERADVIDQVYDILERIKSACAREHGANGVMLVSGGEFSYVDSQDAASRISLVYINDSGTRVEFGSADRGNRTSIERGVQRAAAEKSAPAEAPPEELTPPTDVPGTPTKGRGRGKSKASAA